MLGFMVLLLGICGLAGAGRLGLRGRRVRGNCYIGRWGYLSHLGQLGGNRVRKLMSVIGLFVGSFSVAAGEPLPRSTPEAQGVSPAAIRNFIETADKKITTMHSVMIVRHGQVITEAWWKPQTPETSHVMFSLSKSFTSTAVGLVIEEGKLSLDDEVLKFFPEEAPAEPSKNLKAMRVRDLLTMSTGHNEEPKITPFVKDSWVKLFLAHPVAHKPGTHFVYNTPATYMLSAIVQKQAGKTLLDYLTPKLFEPLGIEKATWTKSPQGISVGG
jgi:CubicO group peptidase (beta-lactamase class C family)